MDRAPSPAPADDDVARQARELAAELAAAQELSLIHISEPTRPY